MIYLSLGIFVAVLKRQRFVAGEAAQFILVHTYVLIPFYADVHDRGNWVAASAPGGFTKAAYIRFQIPLQCA